MTEYEKGWWEGYSQALEDAAKNYNHWITKFREVYDAANAHHEILSRKFNMKDL